jgi:hypothetical protein
MAGIDHALDRVRQIAMHVQIAPKPWGQGGFGGKLCQSLGRDDLHDPLSLEFFPFKRNQLRVLHEAARAGLAQMPRGLIVFSDLTRSNLKNTHIKKRRPAKDGRRFLSDPT